MQNNRALVKVVKRNIEEDISDWWMHHHDCLNRWDLTLRLIPTDVMYILSNAKKIYTLFK